METVEFVSKATELVKRYYNSRLNREVESNVVDDDIYVVWYCRTLQNSKGLLSTTVPDGMYYEVTYNGDKEEFYFDAYVKKDNICVPNSEVFK